jgi:hypothetical protein
MISYLGWEGLHGEIKIELAPASLYPLSWLEQIYQSW